MFSLTFNISCRYQILKHWVIVVLYAEFFCLSLYCCFTEMKHFVWLSLMRLKRSRMVKCIKNSTRSLLRVISMERTRFIISTRALISFIKNDGYGFSSPAHLFCLISWVLFSGTTCIRLSTPCRFDFTFY